MASSPVDIHAVAHLARLELTPAEEAQFATQLGDVLAYMEQLKEAAVEGVEPLAHAVPLNNVARPDQVRPSLPQAAALSNAPASANGLFIVPKIVE